MIIIVREEYIKMYFADIYYFHMSLYIYISRNCWLKTGINSTVVLV